MPLISNVITHNVRVTQNAGDWPAGMVGRCEDIFKYMMGVLYPACTQVLELSVVLTDDREIQALNAQYRGIDQPTNVLSFPIFMAENTTEIQEKLANLTENSDHNLTIGDVILSFTTICDEAQKQHKTFTHHFTHLFIHGVLHLLGHDHQHDDTAQQMEHMEISLLEGLNIENPYE